MSFKSRPYSSDSLSNVEIPPPPPPPPAPHAMYQQNSSTGGGNNAAQAIMNHYGNGTFDIRARLESIGLPDGPAPSSPQSPKLLGLAGKVLLDQRLSFPKDSRNRVDSMREAAAYVESHLNRQAGSQQTMSSTGSTLQPTDTESEDDNENHDSFSTHHTEKISEIYEIANDYVNQILGKSNPFDGRSIEALTPEQMVVVTENALFNSNSITSGIQFLKATTKDNIVVFGAAPRCGAFAVTSFVDALVNSKVQLLNSSLSSRVPWIEGKTSLLLQGKSAQEQTKAYKVAKSFLSCRALKKNALFEATDQENLPKMIVVVRNPLDIRLSYFRFIRRMFRKVGSGFNELQHKFDDLFDADDFCRIGVAPINAVTSDTEYGYEENLADWIEFEQVVGEEKLLFVFYEELLHNSKVVLAKISNFLKIPMSNDFRDGILQRLALNNPKFSVGTPYIRLAPSKVIPRRHGCTNLGYKKFSPLNTANVDLRWMQTIKQLNPPYPCYEAWGAKYASFPSPSRPRITDDVSVFQTGRKTSTTPRGSQAAKRNSFSRPGNRVSFIGKFLSTRQSNLASTPKKTNTATENVAIVTTPEDPNDSPAALVFALTTNPTAIQEDNAIRRPNSYYARRKQMESSSQNQTFSTGQTRPSGDRRASSNLSFSGLRKGGSSNATSDLDESNNKGRRKGQIDEDDSDID